MFLLGTLPDESSLDLREHLSRGCEYCSLKIREAARTVYVLSVTTKPVSPAPRIKDELLRLWRKK